MRLWGYNKTMKTNTLNFCNNLKKDLPPIFSVSDILPLIKDTYLAPQKKLNHLEKNGFLKKIYRGFYSFDDSYNRMMVANTLHSPSYISYESALGFYGMIPEKVEMVFSVTQSKPLRIKTTFGDLAYRSQSTELYAAGMSLMFVDNNPILIASKEKALLDALAQHKLKASGVVEKEIYEYVVEGMRIEVDELFSLSMIKLKKLAYLYRNFAPRKLVNHISQLKKAKPK